MAFQAGSIVGHLDLETGAFVINAGKAMGATKGMTGSMFKAQVAWAAAQKVFNALTGVVKDSVAEWNKQAAVIAQTNAVLKSTNGAAGMTAKAVGDLASSLQDTTTFADDAIQGAENLLLTFTKIGKDTFPEATKIILDMSQALGQDLKSSAIQVGKALQDPVLGVTALRRVGVNFSESQQEVIKNLVATGQSAKAQAFILKELQTEFGGSAAAARDTFGGALSALENKVGDVKETIGQYIAAAGRPLVENLIKGAKGVEDWMKSAQGMEVISNIMGGVAAGFETIKAIVEPIVQAVWPEIVKIGKQVEGSLAQIFGKGQEAAGVFTVLSVVSKSVALALTIVAKVIQFTIQTTGNLINAIKLSIEALVTMGDAVNHLGDPKYAKKALTTMNAAGEAWKKFVVDQATGIVDIVSTGVNGVKNIIETAEVDGKKMAARIKAVFRTTKDGIVSTMKAGAKEVPEQYRRISAAIAEENENQKKLMQQWAEARKTIGEDDLQTKLRQIRDQADAYKKAGADAVEVDRWVAQESAKAASGTKSAWETAWAQVEDVTNKVTSMLSMGWDMVSGIWNQALENEATAIDNNYKRRKDAIEASTASEEEKTAQLEALDEEYAAQKAEIQKKQWAAQQASAITGAIMSGAQAVMTAFSQLGPIGGLIALPFIVGLTAAQVALIASQPMPEFAAGGVGRGPVLVGELGPEVVNLGSTSRIMNNRDTERLMSGKTELNANFYGPVNSDVDVMRVLQLTGLRYAATKRGAA